MRFGLIIYGTLDTMTGGYLYDRKLVEHLRHSGHSVEIIGLPWRSYGAHLLDNFNSELLARLQSGGYDILLQDELNHPSLFHLNWQLKGQISYPVVSIVHHLRISERHPLPLRPFYRLVERHYLASVDAFVYNSHTTRKSVEALLGAKPSHIVAVPSGSRFAGMTPGEIVHRATQERPLQIIFVGSLIERKGLHILLDALAQLPVSAQLVIIGDTTLDPLYTEAIRRKIRTLNLENVVEITGLVEDDHLREALATADVLVVPARYEGFGIVYLEGMAFGLPAIGTTGGAAGEIITPGVDGFLITPGDVGALTRHLTQLAEDRSRLQRMGLAAHRRFDAHPSWEETTAEIENFLKTIG